MCVSSRFCALLNVFSPDSSRGCPSSASAFPHSYLVPSLLWLLLMYNFFCCTGSPRCSGCVGHGASCQREYVSAILALTINDSLQSLPDNARLRGAVEQLVQQEQVHPSEDMADKVCHMLCYAMTASHSSAWCRPHKSSAMQQPLLRRQPRYPISSFRATSR